MATRDNTEFGPWSPGLNSTIPNHLMPRVTLFDPQYSFVSWDEAKELSEATGLKAQELAVTRPERLALHSVLIRVTSSLWVPDGPNYADLGINLRRMANNIYRGFVVPEMEQVTNAYNAVEKEAEATIATLLKNEVFGNPSPEVVTKDGILARLFGRSGTPTRAPVPDGTERALRIVQTWRTETNEDVLTASKRAIARTLGSVLNKRGALVVGPDIISKVALGLVMNRLGSTAVGRCVEDLFASGVKAKNYQRLPPQAEPVVLNAKGASASGKSTIRNAQRQIAEGLGLDWRDFAIISPDYWRKALLDYESLGADYKYAAMMTGHELEVIDRKLDILMGVRGRLGTVPHMLIDRFRFDSFHSGGPIGEDSKLLTRFGSKVYLFFLITPPAETVKRAWKRGQETGRYKAVDDLLYHNIEAYSGMPDLFFTWASAEDRRIHFEFLDNSVPLGQPPRSIAFGRDGHLIIADLKTFCDIEQFRHVDVYAEGPQQVFKTQLSSHERMAIVRRAFAELPAVDVLVSGTNQIFARSKGGKTWVDPSKLPDFVSLADFGEASQQTDLGEIEEHFCAEIIGARKPLALELDN